MMIIDDDEEYRKIQYLIVR